MGDAVITALEEQVGCYRRLAKLAEAQHEFVQQSQTEALLDVLGRRQQVLERIESLERNISPAKKRWQDYLGELAPGHRAKAEELLAESRHLLESITAADRNDALALQQQKLSLGRQINQATAARQVNRNYAAAAYGTRPARMDLTR